MRVGLTVCVVGLLVVTIEAHGIAEGLNEPRALSPWDLLTCALLLGMALLYARGSRTMAARGARHPRRERICFWVGWLTLLGSVLPPLDALALQMFSAHMAQHELMMLLGAPLLMAGRPLSTCLWGLDTSRRQRVATALQTHGVGATWRLFTAPVVAWALHGLVIWVWHLPSLYEWAIHNESVHAMQHAMFIATSALFWWGLLYGRYGRAGYGAAVLYVFTTAVHTGILGALIPLAVPFLAMGEIGAVGVIIALCIASSVVDSSPFSTSGALVVANTPEDRRDRVYKRLLQWGMSMIIIAPITAWSIFVLPGWL